MIDIVRERCQKFDLWRHLKSVPVSGIASGPACGFCRIKQFLDLKRVDFIEVNLPKFA